MNLLPVFGVAAASAMVITLVVGRAPPKLPPPVVKAEPYVPMKTAMEELYPEEPKKVKTIPITRTPVAPPAPAEVLDKIEPVPATQMAPRSNKRTRVVRNRSIGRDICARHNMRKVVSGRSWRCRR